MALPSKFGEFWPDGNYVGWDEDLTAFFNNEMPADEKAQFDHVSSYIYFVSQKLITEPGCKPSPDYPPVGSVAAHEAPKRFKTTKSYSSLASFITLTNRIVAVDTSLKNLFERVEPGVHHFFPIEIEMPNKAVYPKQFFVLVIGRYLDSFSSDQSNPDYLKPNGLRNYLVKRCGCKQAMSGLAFFKQGFGGAHLWRESCITNELFCLSDELKSEITRLGLRLPKHYRMKEI